MLSKYIKPFIGLFLLVLTFESYAGVVIGGTRFIYDENRKELSVSIRNPDNSPYLIQSWLSNIEQQEARDIPFIVTPPLFRLNADSSSALRIVKTGNLPDNRESVFWLNIKSIPTSDPNAKNQLNISVNSRVKLFYRPASLTTQDAVGSYKKVSFYRAGNQVFAKNPTPFYISMGSLNINGRELPNPGMIAPMSEKSWSIPAVASSSELQINWSVINDYGARTAVNTHVKK
ncbi:fimbrial biogenesis chaperone [Serratia aquatilis]|uniref:Molecular chaperone n=1 Tax=Serratia aquatilis TaxID=1737515 RepID=A0ABV6EK62_9GAMM